MRPDYAFDADPTATVTNLTVADNPEPQNIGVYSPNAVAVLGPATLAPLPAKYLSGLTLSNVAGLPKQVQIDVGDALDSTGTTHIRLTTPCTVGLNHAAGLGGLDTGGTVLANTTYFFFVVSAANGANANCMASTSLTPSFLNTSYTLKTTGNVVASSPAVFNVGGPVAGTHHAGNPYPLGGMAAGDSITDSLVYIPAGATIISLQSFALRGTGTATSGSKCVTGTSPLTGVQPNMSFSAGSTFPDNTYVGSPGCSGSNSLLLNNAATSTASVSFQISGNYTINLDSLHLPSTAATGDHLTIYDGRYRLVGALNTDSSSNIVAFHQNGDNFMLDAPVADINTTLASTSSTTLTLASVPGGISVEGLGRCIGGNTSGSAHIVLSSASATYGTASNFPATPGYDVHNSTAQTAYPFRLYTNAAKQILGSTDILNTPLQCMTDGWVFHRAP